MKRFKRILSVVLSLVILGSLAIPAFAAEETGITDLSATVSIGEKLLSVSWWEASGKHFLFLPADADLSAVTLNFTASSEVTFDGEALPDGMALKLEEKKTYNLLCGENQYSLTVLRSENIPSMHITTVSGSMDAVHADKSHKEEASVVIASDGEIVLEKDLEYIKGRGNATWVNPKKPYNIKFDKKTDLFGMGKAKKWTLLANYLDKSIIRNHIAFSLAEQMEIPFTSKHIYVDLYINNEYYGNYILCESVEVGETRVDIADLEGATEDANPDIELDECTPGGDREADYLKLKADTQKWYNIPNNPDDITGGYLLEYELNDRYIDEASGFITSRNQTIVLKSPEYASEAQVKYISSFYQEFENAVYSASGYNEKGKHYTDYIDVESFVKMYLFQEYSKNLDAAITSFYIYKDAGSDKFVAAPVWDYDRAFGDSYHRFGMDNGTPDGWWAGVIFHFRPGAVNSLPTVLNALYRHDDFFGLSSQKWTEVSSEILSDSYIKELEDYSLHLKSSATMNALRWNLFSTNDTATVENEYFAFVKSKVIDFLTNRKTFLDKGFSADSVRIFYEANGGKGNMLNEGAVLTGESITLPSCAFTHSSLIFDSWNTKADGSGTKYNPGDTLTLEKTKITFYAQWKEKPQPPAQPEPPAPPKPPEKEPGFFEKLMQSIRDFFNRIKEFFENLFS